jgi:hypothetical protein
LSLGEDGGLGALFGYALLALAIVVLGRVVVRHATGLGVWVIVFMYLLIDDAFEIHEQAGIRIGPDAPVT